jgi:dihydrofolate synthase/folylpolyglutamate synthase
VSDNPPQGRLSAVVERLHALYPRMIDLSTERLLRLLAALDNPQQRLPPVIHVAGTNGKGSTCAFLLAIGEAQGLRVHMFTSPHLVRFNERIRLAGQEVDDDTLEAAFAEVEAINAGAPITVFEVLMACAFLLFARVPADLVVLEVGLGGRYDATNVVRHPAACAIASISLDHRDMLGDTLEQIAFEKAGIMKPGVPVAVVGQPAGVMAVFRQNATEIGAPLLARDAAWTIAATATGLRYSDAQGGLDLPAPSLPGPHQIENAGLAVAAIRAAKLGISDTAIARGIASATWPARLQRLRGRLAATLPENWELWVDGGHNPGGGVAMAAHLESWQDAPIHLIVGMKKAKDTALSLRPLIPRATTLWAVAEPGQHLALPVDAIIAATGGVARPGPTIAEAIAQLPPGPRARVLIWGSLYLAGEVLKADGA